MPPETAALWATPISLRLAEVTVPEAVHEFETQANKQVPTPVRIWVATNNQSKPYPVMTLNLGFTPLREAAKYIEGLSMYKVLYRGNEAVFVAPAGLGCGVVAPIRLQGRCVDALTGKGLGRIEIERVKYAGMKDLRLARTKITVWTDGRGRFDIKLPVLGSDTTYELGQPPKIVYEEFRPDEQIVVLKVSSAGYLPQTVELSVMEIYKDYNDIDVELRKSGSDEISHE